MAILNSVKKILSGAKAREPVPVRQCVEAVEAQYYDGDDLLPEYRGNLLNSALGPIWDNKSIVRALDVPVAFSETERKRSEEYRLHAIGRLSNLVVAFPAHLDVVTTTQLMIRQHYVGGDIRGDAAQDIWDRYRENCDGRLVPIYPHQRSHAHCFGLFGLSGGGKTTALHSALRLFPKVIHHKEYGVNQVVWVKIDCPRSASLKDTLKLLILTFDDLLGTDYMAEIGRKATLADYANKLHRVTRLHHTGLIVLDEMQNALYAVAKNDPLFDFFVNLTNVVGIPVIVSGTPNAAQLFRKTLRSARRISSHGVTTWSGIGEKDWGRFCNQLQKYQWLANAAPLSESVRKYLYSLTQGLPGIAIPLFQLAQYAAIYSEAERLSQQIFCDVFDEKMESLRPMLAAVRSGNKARMVEYDDLLGDTLDDIVGTMEAEAKRHLYYEAAMDHDKTESAIDAVSRLMLLGVPQQLASSLVGIVQREYPAASSQELSNEAARRFYQQKAPSDSLRKPATKSREEVIK
ncbi:AAA family ATPase [Paraburkholderia sp. CNPSo 3076]|uniref:AAA family ATPase n=1 Tax=Paraburkholderia sp. CNPSo 3076 TaxID=2940936 RepID=UPI00224DDF8C|nr:AAA family ATPase [Paraburkholderia sp. CNPSo 3076]MCX5538074.1 AAA family ATPase [Paraburkholderia sp. CNPSo 3076]